MATLKEMARRRHYRPKPVDRGFTAAQHGTAVHAILEEYYASNPMCTIWYKGGDTPADREAREITQVMDAYAGTPICPKYGGPGVYMDDKHHYDMRTEVECEDRDGNPRRMDVLTLTADKRNPLIIDWKTGKYGAQYTAEGMGVYANVSRILDPNGWCSLKKYIKREFGVKPDMSFIWCAGIDRNGGSICKYMKDWDGVYRPGESRYIEM